ncbi:MAG TPA: hypothetical protein ENJ82_02015 [Bacteroidetes bacterium]|nr:hypothetical protein [Bacteroidota bacterium]
MNSFTRQFLLIIFGLTLFVQLFGVQQNLPPNTDYNTFFQEAYTRYPLVPKGILEAVAWTNTRIRHVQPGQDQPSCTGMPAYYGVMGLVADGKGYFHNNLSMVSLLSGKSAQSIIDDPRSNILAYAAAFQYLMAAGQLDPNQPETTLPLLQALSELPDTANATQNFALHSHIYSVLNFLNQTEFQTAFTFPAWNIDLKTVFGAENYRVLRAHKITINNGNVQGNQTRYAPLPPLPAALTSADYPPAIWTPAASCNYSSRAGTPISAVTIHTIQGTYAGAISWFQNCAASVSAHYVVRSADGQVTQMVLESAKAWHVGSSNPSTIGIEHEGYVADAAWYTNPLYASTVDLVQDIANSGYGIDLRKTYYGPPSAGLQTLGTNCYKIKGHQHFPNQTHVDPGIHWDWDRFYKALNGTPPSTSLTTCSGNFSDTGGPNSNYSNQERQAWHIAPANATSLTLNFTSFNTEAGYDYLYIYDGPDHNGQFLGRFDGTNLPGPFTANSGEFYLEFRADCATTRPGWTGTYTCTTAPLTCGIPTALNHTNLNPFGATLNWTAPSSANSYEFRVRHSLNTTWETFTATTTTQVLTGLKANSLYLYQVRSLCGTATSTWIGGQFYTPAATDHTVNSCTGTFRDTGGNLAQYQNYEDYTYTIAPTGAGSITINFTSFDVEANYDFLYIHDGNSTAAPLIGTYTGTNSPGTVTSSGGAITLRFTSDQATVKNGWEANWTCSSNLAPIAAIAPVSEWYADDFTAQFTDTDNSNSGIALRFYQALEHDGTAWTCNRDNGFLFETFDNGFSNWTTGAGNAYILNNNLHQADTNTTNTNVYIDVAQGAASAWLYTFSARLWAGSSNRRFGIHIFADNPTATQRGNSYLIWFRGDNQTVEIYETINNTLNLRVSQPITLADFVWNDYKIAYQPGSGLIEVYQEQTRIAFWTDSSPLSSGSHVSLRTNQAHMDFENVRLWKARGNSQNIKIGPAATEDCRFESPNAASWAGQVHAISRDNAQNWSNIDFKQFKIDWTPPSNPAVADGLAADIDTSFQNTTLSANWSNCVDGNSGIRRYEFAIGTTAGGTNVQGWTANALNTSVTVSGLNLQHNQRYFVAVRAVNLAELPSAEVSSDGQLVWSPLAASPDRLRQYFKYWPNPAGEWLRFRSDWPGRIQLRLRDAYGRVVRDWVQDAPGEQALELTGLAAGPYWLEVMTAEQERIVMHLSKL